VLMYLKMPPKPGNLPSWHDADPSFLIPKLIV